jgi:hypothetical protein
MRKRTVSIVIAICIVFSIAVFPVTVAAAAGTAIEMSAEVRSRFGFNTSITCTDMLEDTLAILSVFPEGMIKELTDGYRRLGITPSIRQGQWSYYGGDGFSGLYEFVTGRISLSRNNVTITLYMSYALAHEVGHAVDFYLGRLAGRSSVSYALANFNDGARYGEEYDPDVFSSDYGSTSHYEDYAEIVEHLFFAPGHVRDYILNNPGTPLTRKYHFVMEQIVSGFSSLESLESTFPAILSIGVLLDGRTLSFDVPPQTINSRTMVPLRAIFQELGAAVDWNADTQTVTASRDGTVVVMTIGSTAPTVNGRVVAIDQPGVVVNRFVLLRKPSAEP